MGLRNIQQQQGFTIIELTLFFAVSGLLLAGMLTGIGLAVANQRFSDSVNGTQSFLQQQYNETQITVNSRQGSDCAGTKGTSECLIIGKIIDFGDPSSTSEESIINTYPVVINQEAVDEAMNSSSTPTDLELLNGTGTGMTTPPPDTSALKDVGDSQQYTVPWAAKLSLTQDSGGSLTPGTASGSTDVRYILVLTSPISGLISTYKLNTTADLFSLTSTKERLAGNIKEFTIPSPSGSGGTPSANSPSVKSCIKSADFIATYALLKVTPGSTQDSVTTQFDTPERDKWCLRP